jgi:hypothetical protein
MPVGLLTEMHDVLVEEDRQRRREAQRAARRR